MSENTKNQDINQSISLSKNNVNENNVNENNVNENNVNENNVNINEGGEKQNKFIFGGNRLNLTPNEVIGYRILPDQWNWTVVLVKKHGPESKYAGEEYSESLAFCRDIYSAVSWIVRHVAAMEGRKSQDAYEKLKGDVASLQALESVFAKAEGAALAAVKNLEERLAEKGIDLKKIDKKMGVSEELEISNTEKMAA